ncbi:manganese transporter [Neofusicoccum parvum]|nr:manganese transporter [Neofusicoccum parvum]
MMDSPLRIALDFHPSWYQGPIAYIDPRNYATNITASASFRFALLFVILISNMFTIFLQSLSVKLGTVTGKNLAENSREHLPKWINIVIYVLTEVVIIATDVAKVIGFAIALNVLGNVPLVAGCAISIIDVLIILLFYNLSGSTKAVRMFEYFVMLLVLARLLSSLKDSIKLAAFLAIKTCLNFLVVETTVSLFTFALFINSAILIVAGASLFNTLGAGDADLFGIYDLLSSTVAPAAGTIFALALLLSGVSAGIVYTITEVKTENVKMTNSRFTSVSALVIWLVIVVMNVTLLVLIGLGKA